jgi:hypothetical protein
MVKFCPDCGAAVKSSESRFCSICGAPLPADSTNKTQLSDKSEIPSTQTPLQNPESPIKGKKKRSALEWVAIILGGIILIFFLIAFIAGMMANLTSGSSLNTQSSGGTTDLNIGDTAILNNNGETVAVTVTGFNQTTGDIAVFVKNIGNVAIQQGPYNPNDPYDDHESYFLDWGGVKHGVTGSLGYNLYPGDSRNVTYSIYWSEGAPYNTNMIETKDDEALKGKLTFYIPFGDQIASWIIKPS